MDLRIVNTCNNNCLYCLEQELRTKDKFIPAEIIHTTLLKHKETNLTFYWGNPLLHPDLEVIISNAQKIWYNNIWLLSNTGWLSSEYLTALIDKGLSTFWFYFYWFQDDIHKLYSGNNISIKQLCKNIDLLSQSNLYLKCIMHVHKWNIKTLTRDIEILYRKFHIKTFEFIDYMLVDRAKRYEKLLAYNIEDYSEERDILFEKIKELNIQVKFVRFNKDFFWKYQEYNDDK